MSCWRVGTVDDVDSGDWFKHRDSGGSWVASPPADHGSEDDHADPVGYDDDDRQLNASFPRWPIGLPDLARVDPYGGERLPRRRRQKAA